MSVLVSFLGRVQAGGGYRPAHYDFGGAHSPETSYFALELARRIRPDRLVLLGTSGSMWDVLLSDQLGSGREQPEHLALLEAAQRNAVTQPQLEALRPLIEANLSRPAILKIIPDCRAAAEQTALLTTIAALVQPGESVTLDVTHGFRHFGMLGIVAAAFLRRVHGVAIANVYYAALDMTSIESGLTPVIDLSGMLDVLGWVEALSAYDASGDLRQFAGPMTRAGLPEEALRYLEKSAFSERNQSTERAVPDINAFRNRLDQVRSPALDLLRPSLEQRLAWTGGTERWRHEAALADRQFERADWLRAAILWTEAAVSRAITQSGGDPNARHLREDVEAADIADAFLELKNIRNALAHGNPIGDTAQRKAIAKLVAHAERLPVRLWELAHSLELTSLPKPSAAAAHA